MEPHLPTPILPQLIPSICRAPRGSHALESWGDTLTQLSWTGWPLFGFQELPETRERVFGMWFITRANKGGWQHPQCWVGALPIAAGTPPALARGLEELSREITRLPGCKSDPLAVNVIWCSALPAPRELLPGSTQINQLCRLKSPPGTRPQSYQRQEDASV